MNRNYNLKLDLQFRCNNSIMTFNELNNNIKFALCYKG